MSEPETEANNQSAPPALAATPGSAKYRVKLNMIGSYGTVFYDIQERRWWGWKTVAESLGKLQVEAALKELTADWPNSELSHGGHP